MANAWNDAWIARAQEFLWTPVNTHTVTAFRVTLAFALVYFFWPDGTGPKWPWNASPQMMWMFEHVWLTTPYRVLCFALIAVFGFGWRPRIIGLLLVAMLAPFDMLVQGAKSRQLMLVALLGVALASGARPATPAPIWPIRLIQWQLSLAYLVNAIAKSHPAYFSGEVLVGLSRMMPNFLVDLSDGYLHAGPFALPVWLCATGTVLTEYFVAIGFWFRCTRVGAAIVGVAFHAALMGIVQIYNYDWATMFLYLVFLLPFGISGANPCIFGRGSVLRSANGNVEHVPPQ